VITHVLDRPLKVGTGVHGAIDWPRRFDHMQQHTGQHVLSAALDRLLDNRTVSFHMGATESTIDVARELSPADLERGVDEANRIVWEDRPVRIRFASEDEARALPLRKESVRQGELRLIDVEDFDLSACGGTHVARAGAIGVIAIVHAERFKGGQRLTFVCGGRALRVLRAQRDAVAGAVRSLSVLPQDLPAAVEKVQAESKALRKQVSALQVALASQEAASLLAATPASADGVHRIVKVYDGWDANGLKAIASSLVAQGRAAVALVSTSSPALVVVARSEGVALDASVVLGQLTARFGGRGGGKAGLAQAGGLDAPPPAIAEAVAVAIGAAWPPFDKLN
jgi:alanyl-tRNA synthetase